MLDLEKLVFEVDTSQLDLADQKLGKLATSVSNLAKPMQTLSTATVKATKEQEKQTKATEESTEAQEKANRVLQKQQDILKFMTQGYSRGQASIMATAKSTGALTDELEQLGDVQKKIRTLMGTDPFDKSIGAIQKLTNEYTVLKEVNRLYAEGLGLTKSQMEDLAREKLRLIEQYKIEGKAMSDIKNGIRELNVMYLQVAGAENEMSNKMKASQKATSDTAKANLYLEKELEKVRFQTEQVNQELTRGASGAILRFQNALKISGKTLEEQTVLLKEYREAQQSMQKATGNRQVDYLSRALGPQITDVFVGLATGQSPMMVLLQQGGQLRDQFALAGVAGAQMGDMLTKAAASMIVSVKEVTSAIGGLLINVLIGTGKRINDVILSLSGLDSLIRAMKGSLVSTFGFGAREIIRFGESVASVAAAWNAGLLAVLGASTIAMYKFTKAQDDFIRANALTGASLGLTKDSLDSVYSSMQKVGVTTFQTNAVLTEMAKTGGLFARDIEKVTVAATDLEKYGGVAIAETVKQYEQMREKPVESLFKLAEATGLVDKATLRTVVSLKQQGDEIGASNAALNELSRVHTQVASQMQRELSPLAKFWIDIKEGIKGVIDEVVNIGLDKDRQTAFVTGIKTMTDTLLKAFPVMSRFVEIRKMIQDAKEGAKPLELIPSPAQKEVAATEAKFLKEAQDKRIEGLTAEQKLKEDIAQIDTKINFLTLTGNKHEAEMLQGVRAALVAKSDIWNVILGREKNSLAVNQLISDQQIKQLSHQREMAQLGQGIFTEEDLINETARIKLDIVGKQVKLAEKEIEIAKDKRAPESELLNLRAKIVEIQTQGLGIIQDKENALEKLRATRSQEELKRWQEFFAEFKKETKDNENRVNQMFDSQQKAGIEAVRNAELQVKFLDAEYKLMGLTQEQRSLAVSKAKEKLTYEAAIKKIQEQLDFDPAKQKTLIDLETQKYKLQIEALDKAAKIAKEIKLIDDITDAIVTGITKGAKEGAKKLRDIIAAELRKPIEVAVRASVSGAVGKFMQGDFSGALGSLTGGVSNLLGFGGGSSVYSQFATSGIGEALGLSQTVDAIGGLTSASTALTSAGTAFASAMPYVSAAITAYQVLGDMFGGGGGEKSSTGYGYGINSTELSKQPGGAAEQYALGLTRQFSGLVSGLGGTSKLNTGAFWSSDPLGDALTQLQVAGSVNGSEVYARSNRGLSGHNGIENVGRSDAELQAALNEEAARLLLAALKASDISDEMKSIIGVTDAYTSSLEEVQGAITRATAASNIQERIYQLTATDAEKLTRARQLEKDAMDAALGPMLDRLYALEDEKKILDERKELEKKLYELMGDTAKLREIELATLAPANRDLQKNIWAIEDAIAAHEKYTKALEKAQNEYDQAESKLESARNKVQSIRDTATNNYLQALEKVKGSQEAINAKSQEIANSFKEIAKNLRDYVLDTQKPTETFGRVLKLALGGDAEAMQKLPSLATAASELAKNSSGTLVEFKRSQQTILNGVSAAADLADRLGVGATTTDPMVKLQNDLLITQQELAEATRVANSIQAPLVANQNKLIDDYATAMRELADAQLAFATATATLDAIKGNTAATAANTSTAIQRTAELIGSLTGGFDKIDKSLDGLLSAEEIKLALGDKATGDEIVALINAVDANRDGVISRLELLNMTTATVGQAIQMLSSTVLGNFNNIDTSLDGLLTYDELRAGLAASTTKEEINRLIASVDANKDGVISRLELLQGTLVNVGTNIVQGIGASIRLTQAVTFSATDPMRSVFENISRTNIILIEQFKKYLETASGSDVSYDATTGSMRVSSVMGFMTPTNRGNTSGGFAGTYALQYDATNYLMNINTLMLQVLGQLQAINLNSYNDSWNTSDMAYTLRMAAFGGYSFLIRGFGPGASVIVSSNNQSGTPSYFADGGAFTNSIVNRPTAFNMGIMGEAGPEAIMPLRRGIDGSLGVEMHNPNGYQGMDTRGIEARLDRLESTMSNAMYQVAKNTQKTSKSLEKWDGDGMPGVRSYDVPA